MISRNECRCLYSPDVSTSANTHGRTHLTGSSVPLLRVLILLLECWKLSVSGCYFHFRSSSPVIFGFCKVANRFFLFFHLRMAWSVTSSKTRVSKLNCLHHPVSELDASKEKMESWTDRQTDGRTDGRRAMLSAALRGGT